MSPLPHILSVGLLSHWVDVLFALDTPLAADAGFEPAHKGIKVPGLTAWLIGYIIADIAALYDTNATAHSTKDCSRILSTFDPSSLTFDL